MTELSTKHVIIFHLVTYKAAAMNHIVAAFIL
jgi:hypothetical protein